MTGRNPDPADDVDDDGPGSRLDAAFAEYLRACDDGRTINREAFLSRFPDMADQLADLMQIADSLGNFVAVTEGDADSGSDLPASFRRDSDDHRPGKTARVAPPLRTGESDSDPGVTMPAATGPAHNAETLQWSAEVGTSELTEKGDQWLTLPAVRKEGQSGAKLPYDLGDYRLLSVLGRGGMGVVYLAEQKGLGRRVAVKMIRSGILATEAEVRRFSMEAKAAAALEHPNIVSVYQSGYLDGHYYFSMEYVPGVDLAKMIEKEPLQPRVAARYVRDVARAIDHAHRRGVLHRDLKPANVLITPEDEVRVTDFGLAKQIDTDSSVTGSGTAVGTPSYMAPEQASGHSDRVKVQSDVYALGAILFAAISGRPPFGGDGVMQTLMQVIHQPAPSLKALVPDVPDDLDTIVSKCLEKLPEDRYRTATALAEELDAFLEERPIKARPRPLVTRIRHWLEQVPLIAAVLGRRVVEPSPHHRRFQAAMLSMLIIVPLLAIGAVSLARYIDQQIPATVRIAGGLEGGVYDDFSRSLANHLATICEVETEVISSSGSLDNRQRLVAGEVHLAPMQAGAMDSEDLCVVAPLFFEAVHILVRQDSDIVDIGQIRGHEIAVGPTGSGSRLATELLLESLDCPPRNTPRRVLAWPDLVASTYAQPPQAIGSNRPSGQAVPQANSETSGAVAGESKSALLSQADAPQIAIICIGKKSRLVKSLIAGVDGRPGQWRLLNLPSSIDISIQHPIFKPMIISPDDYPEANLPREGISTVGTTAFLATRWRTPDQLVNATLEAIYANPSDFPGLIARDRASEWQGLGFHPAARRYYYDRFTKASQP